MGKDYTTDDGSRIAPLSEMKDFQVAKGYRDIRGWRVDSADGTHVGKVDDLMVDMDGMRTRYLNVRLESAVAAVEGDRNVLVPIGSARIADDGELVVLPLNADRVTLLPPYDHGALTRIHESEVRRHFTLGEAAASAAAATVGAGDRVLDGDAMAADPADREFYDHEVYDDRKFFRIRPRGETNADEPAETRIPLDPEDSVVLKRGEDGNDEIIVRRPHSG